MVTDLAEASIALRFVVLSGLGVLDAGETHRDQTAALLDSLSMPRGSIVYIIEASEIAQVDGDRTPQEIESARDMLKERLKITLKPKGAKVAVYSLEKQWS